MKKIMFVNRTMDTGGIERFLLNVAKNLDSQKYQIAFLSLEDRPFSLDKEIEALKCKHIKIGNNIVRQKLTSVSKLYRIFKTEKPDVVHAHLAFWSAYVMLAAKLAGVKVRITHAHSTGGSKCKLAKKLYQKFCRNIIIANSTHLYACSKDAGVTLFGQTDFEIVANGIALDDYRFSKSARLAIRKKLNIKPNEILIGHVGRFSAPKNHQFLIKIFQAYHGKFPNSKLLLLGSGELESTIKTNIKQANLTNHVTILKNKNLSDGYYSAMDFMVFPSIFEGLPLSLVEAQANHLPILASDSISKEVVVSPCLQFYSLAKSPEAWAEQLTAMSPRDTAQKSSAIKKFAIESTIKELSKTYDAEVKNG